MKNRLSKFGQSYSAFFPFPVVDKKSRSSVWQKCSETLWAVHIHRSSALSLSTLGINLVLYRILWEMHAAMDGFWAATVYSLGQGEAELSLDAGGERQILS